jgi:hypothetical protein
LAFLIQKFSDAQKVSSFRTVHCWGILHLASLGYRSPTHICISKIKHFLFIWDRVSLCCPDWTQIPGCKHFSCLRLSSSGDYRCVPLHPATRNFLFCFVSWHRIFLFSPAWPCSLHPPASTSQVLGLQACTTTPSSRLPQLLLNILFLTLDSTP